MTRVRILMLWALPFLCFLAGYFAVFRVMRQDEISVPQVIGLPLADGLARLDEFQLYGQLVRRVVDASKTSGTILSQDPLPGQLIRTRQPVALVVVADPEPHIVPHLLGCAREEVLARAKQHSFAVRIHEIEHPSAPAGICIAQFPLSGETASDATVDVYCSGGSEKLCILPSYVGMEFDKVREACARSGIRVRALAASTADISSEGVGSVLEQMPSPGAVVSAPETVLQCIVQ